MPFAKRGDVVHSEATSGFNNQKKSLLINGLAALGDSHRPLQQLKLQAQDPQDTPTQAVSRARSSRSPQPSSTARHRLA